MLYNIDAMQETILEFFKQFHFSKEVITLLISTLPIFELRGAIPIAVLQFNMPIAKAYILSVIGNLLPILPILYFLEPIRKLLSKIKFMDKFFTWLYDRTYKKSKNVMKYGAIGLTLFVAIPLPVTGAWTGAVAALLFEVPPKYAFPSIILGVLTAGVIVSLITLGFV